MSEIFSFKVHYLIENRKVRNKGKFILVYSRHKTLVRKFINLFIKFEFFLGEDKSNKRNHSCGVEDSEINERKWKLVQVQIKNSGE